MERRWASRACVGSKRRNSTMRRGPQGHLRPDKQREEPQVWRWRDAAAWRTAVPHGKGAIGPSLLFYSSNGEDVSFPQVMGLTLSVRGHKNSDGSYGS